VRLVCSAALLQGEFTFRRGRLCDGGRTAQEGRV